MSASLFTGPSVDPVLAELIEQITDQFHAGQPLDLDACIQQHPERADELRRLWPALQMLAVTSSSAAEREHADSAGEALTGILGDFRILREIGRGGMGVVYEAEQISLGRRVALKVLPFASTLDSKHLQRFKNEAHAAAQLHHTNIVPVFATGCERGVHYYAMQFIEGQTLAAVIADMRASRVASAPGAKSEDKPANRVASAPGVKIEDCGSKQESGLAQRRQAAEGPLSPSRLCASQDERALTKNYQPAETPPKSTLEARASTVDTGPMGFRSSILDLQSTPLFRSLAELGQQVAEALDHAHEQGIIHRDIKPSNLMLDGRGKVWITDFGLAHVPVDKSLTITGDLIGTLRYMSPEQALAKRVIVDHRTDIYSLGATLYELLTLEPAYGGTDRQELLRQIAFEEPRPLRRINPRIPAELETIVLKALEKNPADRYATAKELADDLQRYLLHEPIRAKKPTWIQRASKWFRRHPALVRSAVVILILITAGSVLSSWVIWNEKQRTGKALEAEAGEHARAEREKAIAQAVRYFLRDKLLAQMDPRAQADALRKAGKPGELKPNPTIRDLLDLAAQELAPDEIQSQFPDQPLVQAELLKTIGEAYGAIGEYPAAISHLERARDLQMRDLPPNHVDTLATITSLARTHLDARHLTEAAHLFEQVHDRRKETLGEDDLDTLASMNDLARCQYAMRRHEEALAIRKKIVVLRTAKLGPNDPDTLTSMNNLANSYAALKNNEKALELHKETLRRRKATLSENHPHTLESMNNVANCYSKLGMKSDALELHKQTLELRREKLGKDYPDTLQSMNNVAFAYSSLDQHTAALPIFEDTLALRRAKLHDDHPDTLESMNALAWVLANCPDQKLRKPQRAMQLANEAVKLAPKKANYWNTLGAACYRAGDCKGAVKALDNSMELGKGGDATDWFFLAMAHWRLGDKQPARKWYHEAVSWMEKNKPQDEELCCFRAETAELLKVENK